MVSVTVGSGAGKEALGWDLCFASHDFQLCLCIFMQSDLFIYTCGTG